jgi:hypothetical protein
MEKNKPVKRTMSTEAERRTEELLKKKYEKVEEERVKATDAEIEAWKKANHKDEPKNKSGRPKSNEAQKETNEEWQARMLREAGIEPEEFGISQTPSQTKMSQLEDDLEKLHEIIERKMAAANSKIKREPGSIIIERANAKRRNYRQHRTKPNFLELKYDIIKV